MRQTYGVIGYGRFGKLWANSLAQFGRVLAHDKGIPSCSPLANVAKSDILFLAVPISQFESSVQELLPVLEPKTIVVDMCSVKVYPTEVLQRLLPQEQAFATTHPLFGPDSVAESGIKGKKIVFCPIRLSEDQENELHTLFATLGLVVIVTTPEIHDEHMARSQALVHFLGRAF
ncbi:MAG: prephenate dehydrogenase/arogenate dehydrogenase family protein [Patescibacteria group bacterium]